MKIHSQLKALLLAAVFVTGFSSQAQTDQHPVKVFNGSIEEDLTHYVQLNLDETHPNLLDPKVARDDHENVISSWSELHQNIGRYLEKNDFSWEVEDESITLFQKIYFNPKGEITYYFFNIQNPSISLEKKEEFGKLISDYIGENGIDYQRTEQFAQCGKTRYANKVE